MFRTRRANWFRYFASSIIKWAYGWVYSINLLIRKVGAPLCSRFTISWCVMLLCRPPFPLFLSPPRSCPCVDLMRRMRLSPDKGRQSALTERSVVLRGTTCFGIGSIVFVFCNWNGERYVSVSITMYNPTSNKLWSKTSEGVTGNCQ